MEPDPETIIVDESEVPAHLRDMDSASQNGPHPRITVHEFVWTSSGRPGGLGSLIQAAVGLVLLLGTLLTLFVGFWLLLFLAIVVSFTVGVIGLLRFLLFPGSRQ